MRRYIPVVIAVVVVLLGACVSQPAPVVLPTPEAPCQTNFVWQGIVPGKSTQQDVIDALGPPTEKSSAWFDQHAVPFYAYRLSNGVAAQFVQDRIFFRADGVVDWLEVVVADRDGESHSVRDMLDELGSDLDAIYWNNNYRPQSRQFDVLAGPDQVWVWSDCGVALDTTGDGFIGTASQVSTTLSLRYPNRMPTGVRVSDSSGDNAVLLMFLFPPTTYDGFVEHYMQKIPFGLWDDFFDKIRHSNNAQP